MKIKYTGLFVAALTTSGLMAQKTETGCKSNLKADISYLASDAMQGRLAGSPEDKLSAEYIANQFKKAGLKPYNGITFQPFDIVKFRIATSQCKFEFHFKAIDTTMVTKLVLFRDFYPLNESGMNDSALAPGVSVGFGIEAPSLGYNSYKDLTDLKGKIFIINLGFEGQDTAVHSPFEPFASIASKIETAIKYGAAGVIFIPGPPKAEKPKGELQRVASTYPLPVIYMDKLFFPRENMLLKIKTVIGAPASQAYNVMGFRNNHKKNTVVICAHHDHLGHNEYGNSLYSGNDRQIHNGADDNASGVAAMLELARTLKGRKYKKNNYLFVGFSGEELGLLGSKQFLNQKVFPDKKINYVVNIDMLGRLDTQTHTLIINGTGTSPLWNETLKKIKTDSNQVKIVTSASGLGPSDHASFYLDSIPVLHFFSGQHYDYHKPSDDEEKINYTGMCNSIDVIRQIIAANNKKGKLVFTKTIDAQPSKRSYKVTMGVMPDYAYTGGGMRLDGVTDGKPAQAAGLQRGDVIKKLGEYPVNSVQDYMKALQNFEKGNKVKVEFIRNGETKTTEVQL